MNLSFIPEGRLEELVREFVASVRVAEQRVVDAEHRNVIDPFSALFDAALAGITTKEWMKLERARQAQKSLQNALGTFHQKLLGSVPGWVDTQPGGSVDLRSSERRTIAEVKNKYNTMNSASAEATYKKLSNHLRYTDQGFVAYLVQILPRTPDRYDRPWTYSRKHAAERPDIRVIDGASFYYLVTGEIDALAQIYDALPSVLNTVLGSSPAEAEDRLSAVQIFHRAYGV